MSHTEQIKVSLSAAGKDGSAELALASYSPAERRARALKALAGCWLGAIVAIAIPVLHFILVPLLLLAGPLGAYLLYRQAALLPGAAIRCPSCGAQASITKSAPNWPLFVHCAGCGNFIKIRPAQ